MMRYGNFASFFFFSLCAKKKNLLQLHFPCTLFFMNFHEKPSLLEMNLWMTTGLILFSDSRLFVSLGILWKRNDDDDRGGGGGGWSQVYPRLCISGGTPLPPNPKYWRVVDNEIHAADQFCTRPPGFSMTFDVPVELRPDAKRRGTVRRADWGAGWVEERGFRGAEENSLHYSTSLRGTHTAPRRGGERFLFSQSLLRCSDIGEFVLPGTQMRTHATDLSQSPCSNGIPCSLYYRMATEMQSGHWNTEWHETKITFTYTCF